MEAPGEQGVHSVIPRVHQVVLPEVAVAVAVHEPLQEAAGEEERM